MAEKMQKEFRLEKEDAAEFLRDLADSIEDEEQINIEFKDNKLIQPLTGKIPLRIYQDENGTEVGFKLIGEK